MTRWRWMGLLLGWGLGCGGSLDRPAELTAEEARGGPRISCELDGRRAQPLVLDFPAEDRVALEAAMKSGVAVVAYDCERLRLLPDCRVTGDYTFVGVTAKEERLRLDDLAEVQANLPFGTLDVDLSEGRTIDIAMMMVGQLSTPVGSIDPSQLAGQCEGATHFIRGATVGAFAMTQGTSASSHAALGLLAQGSQRQLSRKATTRRDGSLQACREATTDDGQPRRDCGALLRLDLKALGPAGGSSPVPADLERVCPRGFELIGNKCGRPEPSESYRCKYGDTRTCVKQCRGGNVDSCVVLGVMHANGHGAPKDAARAEQLLGGPCEPDRPTGGHVVACGELGALEMAGRVGPADPRRAERLLDKACRAGRSASCHRLALLRWYGPSEVRDQARAAASFERGCRAGSLPSCGSWGLSLLVGGGVERDQARSRRVLQRACDAGDDRACGYVAMLLFYGLGGDANPSEAALMAQTACDAGEATGCVYLALAYDLGRGADEDVGRAYMLYQQACTANPDHCAEAGFFMMMRRKGNHGRYYSKACRDPRAHWYGPPDECPIVDDYRLMCEAGVLRSCGIAAGMLHWYYRDQEARPLADRACRGGDARACRQLEIIDSGHHSWHPSQRR